MIVTLARAHSSPVPAQAGLRADSSQPVLFMVTVVCASGLPGGRSRGVGSTHVDLPLRVLGRITAAGVIMQMASQGPPSSHPRG